MKLGENLKLILRNFQCNLCGLVRLENSVRDVRVLNVPLSSRLRTGAYLLVYRRRIVFGEEFLGKTSFVFRVRISIFHRTLV